jgi:molybdenum cofactor cytidylyltransferase
MDVSTALRLQAGDVVALVGAGGKTSCLRRLMHELSGRMLVIATTTTKLAEDDASLAGEHHVIQAPDDLERTLADLSDTGGVLLTGPKHEQEGKWTNLAAGELARLIKFNQTRGGILLIEADGAKGARLKAPAQHEPVIPAETTIVVPMLRIDVLGQHLAPGLVHRPARVADLLGLREDEAITIQHLARLMRHADGGLKHVPETALVRVFINAVESIALEAEAQALASILVEDTRISSVIFGSLLGSDPVREAWGRTGVVLLAAGGSKRFGAPKLLESWGGVPILRQVVEMVLASGIDPAVVVLGANFEKLRASIADLPIRIIENTAWQEGQSTSLKLGLRELQEACEAVIFVLGDMPEVGQDTLAQLVSTHRKTLHSIIAPSTGGRLGNPVLFDQRTFDDLLSLEGDHGGRALFERYPPFPVKGTEGILFDIDSPDDLVTNT